MFFYLVASSIVFRGTAFHRGKRREDEAKEKMRVEGGGGEGEGERWGGGISPVSAFHLTLSYIHSYIAQACPEQ